MLRRHRHREPRQVRPVHLRACGDELFVNLFIASELTWPEHGLTVRQETKFPTSRGRACRLVARPAAPVHAARAAPGWVAEGAFRVRINGRPGRRDRAVVLRRDRRAGATATASRSTAHAHASRAAARRLGLRRLHARPDPARGADRHGADRRPGGGRAGWRTRRPGPTCRSMPRRCWSATRRPGRSLRACRRDGRSRSARTAIIRPASARDLELVPFFRVHDSRYMMYWRVATPAAYDGVVVRAARRERSRLRLEARTLDCVVPGEQQSEIDHGVRSDGSTTGSRTAVPSATPPACSATI